jgi:hypothetical protein
VCVRHGACRHRNTTTPLWVNHSIDRAGGANTDDGVALSRAGKVGKNQNFY